MVISQHTHKLYGLAVVSLLLFSTNASFADRYEKAEPNRQKANATMRTVSQYNSNSPIRANAILSKSLKRMELARKKYGTKNARLVHELQQMWGFYGFHGDPHKSMPFYQEWLKVYPKIPSKDQRSYARHALYSAHGLVSRREPHHGTQSPEQAKLTELAEEIVRCVLTAMNAPGSDWTPYEALTKELKKVTTTEAYPEEIREQARKAMKQQMRPDVARANALLKALKQIDLSVKEPSIPSNVQQEFEELGILFSKFREMDKQDLTAQYLDITAKFIHTDLAASSEKLLWEVYKNIDPAWIDNGSIVSGLLMNASYYWQKRNDFAKVAKLFEKATAIEDYDGTGDHSSVNRHLILGDVYSKLNRNHDAVREYEYARKLNTRLMTDGTFDGLQTNGLEMQERELQKRLEKLK